MSVGSQFLASILEAQDASALAKFDLNDSLFTTGEAELRDVILHHLTTYKTMPGMQAIAIATGGVVTSLPEVTETPEYYYHQMEQRRVSKLLQQAMQSGAAELTKSPPDPQAALDSVMAQVTELFLMSHKDRIADFRFSAQTVLDEMGKALSGGGGTFVEFGWPYLDQMTAGLRGGDVASYVGRPARGKTWFLLWTAMNAWKKQKIAPMFVSMEMQKETIISRLAALHTQISVAKIMKGEVATVHEKPKLVSKLKELKDAPVPFWIIDGNRYVTVDDIRALAAKLNPGFILIDGAYMLRHKSRMGRYEKIAETADQVKHDLAADMNIPVACSYQFNREAVKSHKKMGSGAQMGDTEGLEDIYGSDAIAQLSSIVLGMLEVDNIETMNRRRIRVMKGRHGESGQFDVNWDLMHMDFSEFQLQQEFAYL